MTKKRTYKSRREASRATNIPESTLRNRESQNGKVTETGSGPAKIVSLITDTIRTKEQYCELLGLDPALYQAEVTKWDMGSRCRSRDEIEVVQLFRVKLSPISSAVARVAVSDLIGRLSAKSEPVPRRKFRESPRAVEIALADLHLGMRCIAPASATNYDSDLAESLATTAVQAIVQSAERGGSIGRIVFVLGNDWLHADGVFHTTTKGTAQPEMDSWHDAFSRSCRLAISLIQSLSHTAPVDVLQVPGNHDRQSSFCLGLVADAWFRQNKNVTVEASSHPRKYWQWGNCLIGFDHGHSVKPNRLASVMANECERFLPGSWGQSIHGQRQFHLCDQHRIGSGRPIIMEEQGVSVEFLPSIVASNEWHEINGYNNGFRAAAGFVWNQHCQESRHLFPYSELVRLAGRKK